MAFFEPGESCIIFSFLTSPRNALLTGLLHTLHISSSFSPTGLARTSVDGSGLSPALAQLCQLRVPGGWGKGQFSSPTAHVSPFRSGSTISVMSHGFWAMGPRHLLVKVREETLTGTRWPPGIQFLSTNHFQETDRGVACSDTLKWNFAHA